MSGTLSSQGRATLIASLITTGGPQYLGFGVGSGIAAPSDEALFTEVQNRLSGTVTQATTVTSGDTYQWVGTFTSTATQTLTNLGLLYEQGVPIQGQLVQQVSSSSQNFIKPSNYNDWSSTYPFDVQVTSEVMTVTSGNNYDTLFVTRGVNGSTALTNIPAESVITQVSGALFAKTSFIGLSLNSGDIIEFTIGLQIV